MACFYIVVAFTEEKDPNTDTPTTTASNSQNHLNQISIKYQ